MARSLSYRELLCPFSLEQVTNDTNNIFLERSIPTQGIFAADREVGIAFYNATDNQRVTWTYGVFFDSISEGLKERIDDNQGCRLSGRLTFLPYYDDSSHGRHLVHTGFGVLHTDDQDQRVRFRARPHIHEGPRLIDSGVLEASSYTTGNVESAVVAGPITLQSEAFLCSVDRNTADRVHVQGCYVHASYFLTGENRVFEIWPAWSTIWTQRPERTSFGLGIDPARAHGNSSPVGPISISIKSRRVNTTT